MATKTQQEIAFKTLINELWKHDIDVMKICDDLAYPMRRSVKDTDNYNAHDYLLTITMSTDGYIKYKELREKNSPPKCNFEDF